MGVLVRRVSLPQACIYGALESLHTRSILSVSGGVKFGGALHGEQLTGFGGANGGGSTKEVVAYGDLVETVFINTATVEGLC